eukprot:scaffold100203_cov38-Prasinocladus_malaysianus.AAC.2
MQLLPAQTNQSVSQPACQPAIKSICHNVIHYRSYKPCDLWLEIAIRQFKRPKRAIIGFPKGSIQVLLDTTVSESNARKGWRGAYLELVHAADPGVPGCAEVDIHGPADAFLNQIGGADAVLGHLAPPAERLELGTTIKCLFISRRLKHRLERTNKCSKQRMQDPGTWRMMMAMFLECSMLTPQRRLAESLRSLSAMMRSLDASSAASFCSSCFASKRSSEICPSKEAFMSAASCSRLATALSAGHGAHDGALVSALAKGPAARGDKWRSTALITPHTDHVNAKCELRQAAALEVHGHPVPGDTGLAQGHLPLLPGAKVGIEEAQALH